MHIKMKVKLKNGCQCGSHDITLGQFVIINEHYARCEKCHNLVIGKTLFEVVNGISAVNK